MLRLRFRAPKFRHDLDVFRRSARVAGHTVGRRAGRLWRRTRSRPSRALAAIAVLVMAVSLVAVGISPQARRAVQGGAAAVEAQAKPEVGELPERATATSTTQRNEDGSFTTTVYGGPVNYRGADGAMH